ncbi:MAG: hypothetical protein C0524_02120 [Rhodobacter sp.]|nr:hypothetical protein [Rhodobacter sp.]
MMSAHAVGAEVVLTFGLEQRLEVGSNVDLTVPEGGTTTASVTRLSFGAVSRTQLDTLEFSAASALVVENSDGTGGTEAELERPELSLRYTREVPNALFSVGAQYRRDDADAFDEDISDADLDGTRTDIGADLRIETGRTAPLGFAFTTSFTRTEYQDTTDPTLTDTDVLRVGLETRLRFSEVLLGRVGLGYEREEETDVVGPATETSTASLGMTYLLANGEATADLSFSSDDDEGDRSTFVVGRTLTLPAGLLSARLGVTDGDSSGTDVIGALFWSQELPRGALDLRLERAIGFDDDTDEAVKSTTVSVSFTQDVNAVSSLGLSLSHEISDAPSERIEVSEFGATYRYALTEDWGLDSGVTYRVRKDADGRSDSPGVFVALSRSFEFRP